MIDKNALKAEKERLKQELKYYNMRLRDLQKEIRTKQFYECDSSDSESETFSLTNIGPTISQLKSEQNSQQTCLQATQELTSVIVLQAEVECLAEPPKYERGSTIKERGTWREVTAECRIDLVPFSINFYTHKSNVMFAPTLYRGLSVLPVKKAQEIELSKSGLAHVDKPSDAVEILKSYAKAYRVRRTTLARLADKFAGELHMEPLAEGGYLLKCGSVLELSWRLENRWSPLSQFHHKMKFDLDYMDESHLKTITQAHKKLSDPTIDVNERTLLLSKIISTCLELKQLHEESMDSEVESKKLEKTVLEDDFEENSGENEEHLENNKDLDDNIEKEVENCDKSSKKHKNSELASKNNENASKNTKHLPKTVEPQSKNTEDLHKNNATTSKNSKKSPHIENHLKNAEKEIMAPPKSLPKKTKPKTKENTTDNRKSVKRTAESDQNGTKKAKTTEKTEQNVADVHKKTNNNTTNEKNDQNKVNAQKDKKKAKTNENINQNIGQIDKNMISDKNEINYTTFVASLNEKNNPEPNKKQKQDHAQSNPKKTKENENQVKKLKLNENEKNLNSINSKTSQKVTEKQNIDQNKNSENNPSKSQNKKSKTIEKTSTDKQLSKNNILKAKIIDNNKDNTDINKNQEKNNENKEKETENLEKNTDKILINKPVTKKDLKTTEKNKNVTKPLTNSEKTIKISKKGTLEKNTISKKVTNTISSNTIEKNLQNNEKLNNNVPKHYEISNNVKKNFEKKNTENQQQKIDKKNTNSKEITTKKSTTDLKSTKNGTNAKNMVEKTKLLIKSHKNTPKVKKTGNTESIKDGKISKIPQKKFGSNSDTNLKNILRVSPRSFPTKFKSPSDSNLLGKLAKVHTNIPMLKKPAPKV